MPLSITGYMRVINLNIGFLVKEFGRCQLGNVKIKENENYD